MTYNSPEYPATVTMVALTYAQIRRIQHTMSAAVDLARADLKSAKKDHLAPEYIAIFERTLADQISAANALFNTPEYKRVCDLPVDKEHVHFT